MLAYYTNEKEIQKDMAPRGTVEIVSVTEWNGKSIGRHYEHGFQIDTLANKKYHFTAELWSLFAHSDKIERIEM